MIGYQTSSSGIAWRTLIALAVIAVGFLAVRAAFETDRRLHYPAISPYEQQMLYGVGFDQQRGDQDRFCLLARNRGEGLGAQPGGNVREANSDGRKEAMCAVMQSMVIIKRPGFSTQPVRP